MVPVFFFSFLFLFGLLFLLLARGGEGAFVGVCLLEAEPNWRLPDADEQNRRKTKV